MNIVFFEADKYERGYLEKSLKKHHVTFHNRPIELEDIKHLYQTEILGIFIYSHITARMLQNMPCLKLIVTMSTGYDHIELEACRRAGVFVANIPKYGGACVAEHTFALIFSLLRHIPKAIERTHHDDFTIDNLMGSQLEGKVLGVVGLGTIGSKVAKIAHALGMHVIATTESKKRGMLNDTTIVPFTTLLKKSDIVTLHVPLTKKTKYIINAKSLKLMKRGSYLINTARGSLINTASVSNALKNGKLAGFAADVLEGECELKEAHQPLKQRHHEQCNWRLLRQTHKLLKKPNVLITPHIAFYTKESIDLILKQTTVIIKAFEKGKLINNVIV